jgi:hydrogenase maturation protein HypF
MASSSQKRLRVEIHGAVQGVGFRPFVYRLATELDLTGWVINDTQGVFIEAEGPDEVLEAFLGRLRAEKPPRAIVQSVDAEWLERAGYDQFEIRHSDNRGAKTVLVLPDVATCPECLAEVLDPDDRRYRYPFTNCTNCGPRFSIIQALPYDRPNTTMRRFVMCPDCQAEYENPRDRRFHAQPNACPMCGPKLELYERETQDRAAPLHLQRWSITATGEVSLERATDALRGGQILAVKGLGGFLLMVDARNATAIARLRERKPRRDKPFAIMARDLAQIRSLCEVPPAAETLLATAEAPIVLLRRLETNGAGVAEGVAPANPYLGVMLPYTPLHHLLLRAIDFPVVATSGNLTDEPICIDEHEAMDRLGHIADLFLAHDRPIARHVDDSLAWIMLDEPRLLRRARGYAPLPILLAHEAPVILATGAHLKNTVALSVGKQAFISQHIGDLETPEAMGAFQRVIADLLQLYEAQPVAIAHDLHPDYLSTRWAQDASQDAMAEAAGLSWTAAAELVAVQHHHAHLAACLAENGVEGPALGVIWDGTGLGTDGTIWGGEFLLGDAAGFTRMAHLRPFRLPGGDAAVREPRRSALSLLWEIYGDKALEMEDLAPVQSFNRTERRLLAQMIHRGTNSPITTSMGRLFDAMAALMGFQQQVTFEGQAAMALEFAVDAGERGTYPLVIEKKRGREGENGREIPLSSPLLLDWSPLIDAVLQDLRQGVPRGIMAARFHNAMVAAIVSIARTSGERRVALSGGCFQNRFLAERTAVSLRQAGFEVLLHRQVPPNDGCISLGQVAVAAARLESNVKRKR